MSKKKQENIKTSVFITGRYITGRPIASQGIIHLMEEYGTVRTIIIDLAVFKKIKSLVKKKYIIFQIDYLDEFHDENDYGYICHIGAYKENKEEEHIGGYGGRGKLYEYFRENYKKIRR